MKLYTLQRHIGNLGRALLLLFFLLLVILPIYWMVIT
jgi:ABC-type glycerol-3-phosphate transport system permease component